MISTSGRHTRGAEAEIERGKSKDGEVVNARPFLLCLTKGYCLTVPTVVKTPGRFKRGHVVSLWSSVAIKRRT